MLATYSGSADDQLAANLQDINFRPTNSDATMTVQKNDPYGETFGYEAYYSDVNGDSLKASLVTAPAHGSIMTMFWLETGSAIQTTYVPDQDYTGPDSFTWKVEELDTAELYESNPYATVSIDVTE